VLAYLYDNFNEVNIDFRVTGEEWRFSSNDEVALFRLTQEALQNALKHAKSSNINVSIETFDGYVSIILKDDRAGFNPEDKKDNAFGLVGMKERVDLLHGKLNIRSKLREGTSISVTIPYEYK